ncbi:helix-turn-helix domain-containing protein [Pontibacillus yanchengensis]|uniref:Helix-turn-helix domain-containing protein n=2 Tax=Pontibacillus yanchengensis TaxID=462910 RepID=A0ACC7VLY7_9BACI|nr:helix-turn-helix transcriptional regulator [Pontibacillus yanchengensis]MYL35976.1 helix-turn-helix domain-containing protein [Pontibacillus yanchengensis]MYL55762.1 helix-turn-helix domain-containing protein [Pontibacillus yanchengensis]
METEKWGKRIRAYRKLKGYTQISFARAIGISVSVLGEIERGSRLPNEQVINKTSIELNIPVQELTPKE